jgi:hypothetical protein
MYPGSSASVRAYYINKLCTTNRIELYYCFRWSWPSTIIYTLNNDCLFDIVAIVKVCCDRLILGILPTIIQYPFIAYNLNIFRPRPVCQTNTVFIKRTTPDWVCQYTCTFMRLEWPLKINISQIDTHAHTHTHTHIHIYTHTGISRFREILRDNASDYCDIINRLKK